MQIDQERINTLGKRITARAADHEVGRLYLYVLLNDLHAGPFALIEDVFIREEHRGKGLAKQLVKAAVEEARRLGCYKVVMTSRYSKPEVHEIYGKLGFVEHGKEFRMDL